MLLMRKLMLNKLSVVLAVWRVRLHLPMQLALWQDAERSFGLPHRLLWWIDRLSTRASGELLRDTHWDRYVLGSSYHACCGSLWHLSGRLCGRRIARARQLFEIVSNGAHHELQQQQVSLC